VSAVSECVVREYFEQLGYLVNQPAKYTPTGRRKTAEEDVDLLVLNPTIPEQQLPEGFVWTTADLASVSRAIVSVRGVHTERLYAGTFEQTPEILRFVEPASLRYASRALGEGPIARILCLPRLPASGELKEKTIALLRGKGVSGVIGFQTILTELIADVEVNRNYEKSDLLQIIRLLKIYEFLKDSQMDFFTRAKAVPRRKGTDDKVAPEPSAPTE
jgi:hypothetical protein